MGNLNFNIFRRVVEARKKCFNTNIAQGFFLIQKLLLRLAFLAIVERLALFLPLFSIDLPPESCVQC